MALDTRAAVAAALASRLGRPRLCGFARVPLEPGAYLPSPSGPCLLRPEAVREAVRRAVAAASPAAGRATLVLPDGLARLALVDVPAGAEAREFVRFRLAASLPWPAAEAAVDVLPMGRRRVVAAALRRAAVAEHEQALASAGVGVERVNLAPLLALAPLPRSGPRDAVHVVLGDAAACVAAVRGATLAALRSRRRDTAPGEAARLAAEAERAARLAANGDGASAPALPLAFLGADAARLRRELDATDVVAGAAALGAWPEAAESAWLAGMLG